MGDRLLYRKRNKRVMMRQGPHSKRGRGRGGRRPGVPNRNQTYDSNGPDVRIRGNAHQVYEKYLNLARDASTNGDRILAESYYQYAEHYFRIVSTFTDEQNARGNGQQPQSQSQSEPQSQPQPQQQQDQPNLEPQVVDAGSQEQPVVVTPSQSEQPTPEVQETPASAVEATVETRSAPADNATADNATVDNATVDDARTPTEDDIPALRPRSRRRSNGAAASSADSEETTTERPRRRPRRAPRDSDDSDGTPTNEGPESAAAT